MVNSWGVASPNGSGANLPLLVQKMADDVLTKNNKISRELYEDIAQSLAALRTSLVVIEKKLPAESAEISKNFNDLNDQLKATLYKIRNLAEDLDSGTLTNLGLEPALRELCQQYSIRMNHLVPFESCNCTPVPTWLNLSRAFCLYYLVEQLLEFTAREKSAISFSFECHENVIIIEALCFLDSVNRKQKGQMMDQLLPIMREWLHIWGGSLQFSSLSEYVMNLTACLGIEPLPGKGPS